MSAAVDTAGTYADALSLANLALNSIANPDGTDRRLWEALELGASDAVEDLVALRDEVLPILAAAAAELRRCHDETGIDLTHWGPVRALVERFNGPLDDSREEPRREVASWVIGLPVVVTVYDDDTVLLNVDASEATDDVEWTDEQPLAALTDEERARVFARVDEAHAARQIGAVA